MSEQSESQLPDVKDANGNLLYGVYDSPFGEELNMDSLFHFKPEEFDAETEVKIARWKQQDDADNAIDPDGKDRRMKWSERRIEDRKTERDWLEKYSGKIPEAWGDKWGKVYAEASIESGMPLTDAMIDAAIDHPSWMVGYDLGINRPLNEDQLERLLARNEGHYIIPEIKTAQKALKEGKRFSSEAYRRVGTRVYPSDSGTAK